MTKIKCRYEIIKALGKIKLSIPFKARMKLSFWIVQLLALFITFQPIKKMEIPPNIIEFESQEEADEWLTEQD